jgi:YjbE family integral membrane protein
MRLETLAPKNRHRTYRSVPPFRRSRGKSSSVFLRRFLTAFVASGAQPSSPYTGDRMQFLYSMVRIIIIDLVLSGDNAVIIGMAAHRLPVRQRRQAIVIGGGAAIVLRIILTTIAAFLLTIPVLQLAGGLLLIWIAFKLFKQEEESHAGVKVAASMREAVITILLADFVMSTDNVLGVAGASEGDLRLLLFGLAFSMIILMCLGSIVANLINRFLWLAYVGATVIAWTGALMVFEDPFVISRASWVNRAVSYTGAAVVTVAVTAFAHWFYRVRDSAKD